MAEEKKESLFKRFEAELYKDYFFVPWLQKAESSTGVKRVYIASGFLSLMAVYLVLGSAAQLICNIIGFAYPAYQSLKAIESSSKDDDTKWLVYWVTFAFFSLIEFFSDKVLDWFPPYFLIKVMFMIYLYAPFEYNGSYMMYHKFIRPVFIKNQFQIDQVVNKAMGAVSNVAGSALSQTKKLTSKTE